MLTEGVLFTCSRRKLRGNVLLGGLHQFLADKAGLRFTIPLDEVVAPVFHAKHLTSLICFYIKRLSVWTVVDVKGAVPNVFLLTSCQTNTKA